MERIEVILIRLNLSWVVIFKYIAIFFYAVIKHLFCEDKTQDQELI